MLFFREYYCKLKILFENLNLRLFEIKINVVYFWYLIKFRIIWVFVLLFNFLLI